MLKKSNLPIGEPGGSVVATAPVEVPEERKNRLQHTLYGY